jgi:hypothetical protein
VIEPRTVANTALAVRRSNHSARSHPFVIFVCAGGLAGVCGLAAGGRIQYLVPLALPIALSPLISSIQVVPCYPQTPIVRHLFPVLRIRYFYPGSLFFSIPDPTTTQKRGKVIISWLTSFIAMNFTKLKIIRFF